MRTNMSLVLNLHKKKVKELKYGNDGDAKGEPVDAAQVGKEHFPGVTEIIWRLHWF